MEVVKKCADIEMQNLEATIGETDVQLCTGEARRRIM
jgi:hypothetical protein